MRFVEKIAKYIHENDFELRKLVVVLPSERAIRYLSDALVKEYKRPIFSPQFITINRWVKENSPAIIDKTRLLLTLYEVHLEIEKADPNVVNEESFESFMTWGTMVLSDFDDLERYLLDVKQVFKNLRSIKELESWNIDETNYSASQKRFMEFWERLPVYYEKLNERLQQLNKITAGQAYRRIAENIDVVENRSEHFYLFVGFNALSAAEQAIIRKLRTAGQAEFLIDADSFYLANPVHEAGLFLRRNLEFLEITKPSFVENNLVSKSLDVEVVECAQNTGQVKVAATVLDQMTAEELDKTLLLLGDEALISSLVKNIPSSVGKANITLGLPLDQTPVKSWVELLFGIQENKGRFKSEAIYYKDLHRFINHVFILGLADSSDRDQLFSIEQNTTSKNRIFQRVDHVDFPQKIKEIVEILTQNWKSDWVCAIQNIRKMNALIINGLEKTHAFEQTALQVFDESLSQFQCLLEDGVPAFGLKGFKSLFYQHWGQQSIAYHGNPTNGLQIMGLLETRLLDFKNIIVLGFNEGKLPTTNLVRSILPLDLRVALGLPSTREKQGLFAHHFYRLLQGCERLWLTYTTTAERIGSNDVSRYHAQMLLELNRVNSNISWKHSFYKIQQQSTEDEVKDIHCIEKSPEILARLDQFLENPLSASALNKYMKCPMDFYYRYLVDFGEESAVEEEIESSTFGSFIHDALENLYAPYALYDKSGEIRKTPHPKLTPEIISGMLGKYEALLHRSFMKHFDNNQDLFLKGKNLLIYEVAKTLTRKFLLADKEFITHCGEDVYIIQLEGKFEKALEIPFGDTSKTVRFQGYIDRIDKVGEKYRVIDYKSGKVKPDDVQLKISEGDIVSGFNKCKHALQLTLYCLFFQQRFNHLPDEARISGLLYPEREFKLQQDKMDLEQITQQFPILIEQLLAEMYSTATPFVHDEESAYCMYC